LQSYGRENEKGPDGMRRNAFFYVFGSFYRFLILF